MPVVMIGQGGSDGMTKKDQEKARKKFETECNVMLATSVVEEGIDLPQCTMVIRFDAPSTLIAMVQ